MPSAELAPGRTMTSSPSGWAAAGVAATASTPTTGARRSATLRVRFAGVHRADLAIDALLVGPRPSPRTAGFGRIRTGVGSPPVPTVDRGRRSREGASDRRLVRVAGSEPRALPDPVRRRHAGGDERERKSTRLNF